MAQEKIKKVRFKQADLPPVLVTEEGYVLRYRVVSEDKNRTSHWSPIVTVKPNYTYVTQNIDFNSSGNLATSVWDAVKIQKDSNDITTAYEYDVWIRWDRGDDGDWIYKQVLQGNSISSVQPSTYTKNGIVQGSAPNKYSIEVYLKGNTASRNSSFLLVYEDGPHTV